MSGRTSRNNAFERKGISSTRRRSSTLGYIKLMKENQKEMLKNKELLHSDKTPAEIANSSHHLDSHTKAFQKQLRPNARINLHKTWNHSDLRSAKNSWNQFDENSTENHILPLLEEYRLANLQQEVPMKSESDLKLENYIEGLLKKEYLHRKQATKQKAYREHFISCLGCNQIGRRGTHLSCEHYFCFDCLEKNIQKHIDQLRMPIKCIFVDCGYELTRDETIKYASNAQEAIQFVDHQITEAFKSRHDRITNCSTKGCSGQLNLAKFKGKTRISCTNCKSKYCTSCQKRIGQKHGCDEKHPNKVRAKTVTK